MAAMSLLITRTLPWNTSAKRRRPLKKKLTKNRDTPKTRRKGKVGSCHLFMSILM